MVTQNIVKVKGEKNVTKSREWFRNVFKEVVAGFEKRDCELLIKEEQYTGGKKKIPYICNKHRDKGIQYTTWDNFKRSKIGCKYCRYESTGKRCRMDFAVIERAFIDKGYRLLSKPEDYKTNTTKLHYICPNHEDEGVQRITWADLNSGCGCNHCANEKLSNKFRLDFSIVINRFVERDYILLTEEKDYINARTQLLYLCPNHLEQGILTTTWADFSSGKGCKHCGIERTAKSRKKDIQYWRDMFSEKGCTLVSENVPNSKARVKFTCNKHPGIVQESTLYHFQEGASCCHICGKEAVSGENHHNWKGGVTPEKLRIRNSLEYKYWRIGVLISDGHTCQCCGNRNKKDLRVHHIENFAERPDLRFVISNGITLCRHCHSPQYPNSFHSIYGCFKNNRKQLHEYLSKYGTLVLTNRKI